jgi:hypothetical protein
MAAKLNKDALLKYRFWIIIGVAFVLGLGGVFYLGLIVHADTTKLQALQAQGKGYSPKSNQKTVEQSNKNAETAKASEAGIWKAAWDKQEPLFVWAKKVEDQFNFRHGFFVSEIKVDKLPPDPKEWPKNETPNTLSGKLTEFQPEWFMVQTAEGKDVKFHKTEGINGNITLVGADKKLNFPQLLNHVNTALVTVQYQPGKYFMDPLTMPEQAVFFETYKPQVLDILKIVDPLDIKGNGVVQLKQWLFQEELPENIDVGGGAAGGGPAMPAGGGAGGAGGQGRMNFIRYVSKPWAASGFKSHSEEVWIAQENLWIQKEIYRIIRGANDSISVFDGKAVEKQGEIASFKNSSFEAQLTLNPNNSIAFRVKNRLPRNQKLDLLFRVKTNKALQPEVIKISGPMLTPAGTKTDSYLQEIPETADSPRKGIYSVEQVLTWETAAVKRIDYISIGSADATEYSHSHRTFDKLRPLNESAIPKPAETTKDPMGISGMPGGMGGDGGKGGNQVMLEHGLWNFRYSDVSEQSRRIPVAIVLIVDQDHVDRVLAAFNNSKLRFLQSQVLLNHYTGSLQPPPIDEFKEGGLPGTAGTPMPFYQPMPMPIRGGSQPGTPGMPGMNPLESVSDDLETNMELVIYGTMTLYHRHPPRTAAPAAAPKN